MRVVVSPMDAAGCGQYRIMYPTRVLQAEGFNVEVRRDKLNLVERDVVVLQRPTSKTIALETIPKLQARGFAVVIELDDDLSELHPNHAVYKRLHPSFSPDDNHRWLTEACLRADLVTTSTPSLGGRFAPHGRVAVLPNLIPAAQVAETPAEVPGRKVIGWPGQPISHPHDLNVARRAVPRVLADGWQFLAIGDRETLNVLGVKGDVAEWTPFTQYVPGLRRLDLGIVPLMMSAFNEGKSWLKGLEFAASGVPFVASSTGPYRSLHGLGAGVLADGEKDWVRKLTALARDEHQRRELAEKGLQVAASLTYEQHAHQWWEAWERARVFYEHRPLSPEAQEWVGKRITSIEF